MLDISTPLKPHGLTGKLTQIGTSTRWQFCAERNGKGAAVQIEGEPDQAVIDQAAAMLVDALCPH